MRGFQLGLVLVTILLLHSPALGRKPHRQVVLILDEEDEVKEASLDKEDAPSAAAEEAQDASDWDEFSDSDDSDSSAEDMNLGSWKSLLDHTSSSSFSSSSSSSALSSGEALYRSGVEGMVSAASKGEYEILKASVKDFVEAADQGNAHAQSALGFMLGSGYGFNQSDSKAFLYHHFAAEGGNFHSKMALAYHYFRRQMNEEAAKLYAELAATAVASFWSSKDSLLIEPIRINDGLEENKEGLRKSRGEEDDDFQILEYQARKGNAIAMYKVGVFYYFGLRGVRRDHQKALDWFIKSVEKGESGAMELLGEIYARGSGVERNFTKALEWFQKAAAHKHFSAYNGIGYLYVKGLGVEKRNYTMALDYFKRAAENHNPNGYYNLGVLYLRGKGVKKDIRSARKNFAIAAKDGHLKAYYQLAKFFQKGLGVNKDLITATALFKVVAERGPWGSLLRWAVESYMKGDIGLALLLYTRAAELGYEVAQSNAAWILEKYPDVCLGKSGLCTDAERHQRAHLLWWHASEQGNDDAALLIGDAYYYGHGTEKDLERAAAAYQHARSQANAQAIFNLGYMHEHGLGLPLDLHLAKRYYDEALETDAAAALPVTLALASLWLRQHYGESFLITLIDALPDLPPKISEWTKRIILDEGNVTLMTLFACLLAVLYLKRRQRRRQMVPPPQAL